MTGNLSKFIDSINMTAINQTLSERMTYLNLSDFWKIKQPLIDVFGGSIYFIVYFVIVGVVMVKSRSFAAGAYVGILLGVILSMYIPIEFKPYMFGLVVLFAAGVVLSMLLER